MKAYVLSLSHTLAMSSMQSPATDPIKSARKIHRNAGDMAERSIGCAIQNAPEPKK